MKHLTAVDEERELAKNEAPILAMDLIKEILPLIQDYFVGDVTLERGGIGYRMPNGQSFFITAKAQ